jgi:hypothetical protein
MKRIPFQDVTFHPNSFGDAQGRLFSWDEQLYRGIHQEWTPFFEGLFRDGTIASLMSRRLLIETERTSFSLDGYGMVLKHRQIPFAAYTHEWPGVMLKDAALTIIDIAIELAQRGLMLKDGHPWNVLFDSYQPLFVDLTSIALLGDTRIWPAYEEFCRYVLNPLLLMAQGQERIARWLLWDYDGVLQSDVQALTPGTIHLMNLKRKVLSGASGAFQALPQLQRERFKQRLRSISAIVRKRQPPQQSVLHALGQVRREIEQISLPREQLSYGSPTPVGRAKLHVLQTLLSERRPRTVLNIGSKAGECAKLAAGLGCRVVAFERNAAAAAELYISARDQQLLILPLVMDAVRPTPALGLADHCFVAATKRFRCDAVVALSIVHHMVAENSLDFDQIVAGLSLFVEQWLLIEFVPRDNQEVQKLLGEARPWYTLDNFLAALNRQFPNVRVLPYDTEPRVLIYCEK